MKPVSYTHLDVYKRQGMTLRFSPYHPNQVLQTSEMEIALKETQTRFYALDLKNAGHDFSIDDGLDVYKRQLWFCRPSFLLK